ncbi:fumarylacetoacetate hydrolase [Rhodotorula diobovata]|uniref:Fumarylacetoacetate hydrolase n=1 Tax=Rhodotorula diobovata TaxID=5288 RepID=A0A5C5G4T3_9BASI|nr:fumarylacetoacetate hydrolase [Rhodotorula diobovata]
MATPAWTRLIRFVAKEDAQTYYGEPQQDGDLGLLYSNGERITARVVAAPWTSSPASTSSPRVLTVQTLLSPLAPTDVPAIRGMGLQYSADPANPQDKPPVACLFFKASQALAGPGDDIVLPRLARDEKNDYEVELCVVLGKDAKDVDEKDAMSFVGGYCVVNDVSSRGLCAKGGQWGMGKSYDTWCPFGPCLVSPSALGADPHKLTITTHVNGKLAQKGNTADLVLKIPELIARLSHGTTLQAGSLILTGSPIALGRKAPGDAVEQSPFMKDGDEIRCFVEGCGTLINSVRDEAARPLPPAAQRKAKL